MLALRTNVPWVDALDLTVPTGEDRRGLLSVTYVTANSLHTIVT